MTEPAATPVPAGQARIVAQGISAGYGGQAIVHDLDVEIPDGAFTVIIGPNACGKSTLLRALARMLPLSAGQVLLDGHPLRSYSPKDVARKLSLLPQTPIAPEGIVVSDLVSRGRFPHQGLLKQWTAADDAAVSQAMRRAHVDHLADRFVSELSGGQRQRVWIALVLAQETPIVFLDEPTTYLDIGHQVEVLNLARDMQQQGTTIVAVLHELTLACRYATNIIMMKDGAIVAKGTVDEVVTADQVSTVYGIPCDIVPDPRTGKPLVVPRDTASPEAIS